MDMQATLPHSRSKAMRCGSVITPSVGMYVQPDSWNPCWGSHLDPCDDWDMADFRMAAPGTSIHSAINIVITGRTIQYDNTYGARVKVRIVWVGDGEPDQVSSGWLCLYRSRA